MSRAQHRQDPTTAPRDIAAAARWVVHGGGGGQLPSYERVRAMQAQNAERLQAVYCAREALAIAAAADKGVPYKPVHLLCIPGGPKVDTEKWPYPPVQLDPLVVLRAAVQRGFVRVVLPQQPAANDGAVPASLPAAPHDGTGAPVDDTPHAVVDGVRVVDAGDGQLRVEGSVTATFPNVDPGPGTWGMLTTPQQP